MSEVAEVEGDSSPEEDDLHDQFLHICDSGDNSGGSDGDADGEFQGWPAGALRNHVQGRRDRNAGRGGGKPAKRDVQGEAGEWTRDSRLHLRENANELHPHPSGGQGDGADDALRPHEGAHNL